MHASVHARPASGFQISLRRGRSVHSMCRLHHGRAAATLGGQWQQRQCKMMVAVQPRTLGSRTSSAVLHCGRLSPSQQVQRGRLQLVRASGHQSVDEDEEGDLETAREFSSYEVERFRNMSRHLDLMWNVGKKPKPEPCSCCQGTGQQPCQFCHSTGAMMVGHERFCNFEQGCKPCPICHGTGDVKCRHCKGTGFRAGWLANEGCEID